MSIGLAVYAGIVVLLIAAVYLRPPTALAAVTCMFGLDQLGQVSDGWLRNNSAVTNYLVGILVLVAVAVARVKNTRRVQFSMHLQVLVVLLFGYALLTTYWTPASESAAAAWLHAFPYLITSLLLAPFVVHSLADIRTAMLWTAAISGAITVTLLLTGEWGFRGLIASTGVETNPLALAAMAGAGGVAALAVKHKTALQIPGMAIRLAIVGASLFLIFRTGARGQLLALALALLVAAPLRFRAWTFKGAAAVLIVLALLAYAANYGYGNYSEGNDVRWSKDIAEGDLFGRFEMALRLLEFWSGSLTTMVFGLGNSAAYDPKILGIYPHIVPVEILCEEGLLGAAIFLTLLYVACKKIVIVWSSAIKDPGYSDVAAYAIGMTVFSFILMLKEGSMLGSFPFFMNALVLSRLASMYAADSPESVVVPELALRPHFPNLVR